MSFERLIIGMYEFCKPIPPQDIPDDATPESLLDQQFLSMMKENSLDGQKCRYGMRILSMCHSAYFNSEMNLQWSCPEEFEFITFSNKYHFVFQNILQNNDLNQEGIATINLVENGINKDYVLLDKIEFSSQRKKMSVIVKIKQTGDPKHDQDLSGTQDVLILTKGSDDVVINDLDVQNSPDLASVQK